MYFLGGRIGWRAQQRLFGMVRESILEIMELSGTTLLRMEELMAKYADTPMDFADASLVAIAEEQRLSRIFTLDDHFKVYQINGREPFNTIPKAD
jgi:predicted nucleic acid-binding protein